MSTYHLKPGIAAAITVTFPDGTQETVIYIAKGKSPVLGVGIAGEALYQQLPAPVRAGIEDHFNMVFSYPIEERARYLSFCNPLTVEVTA